MNRRAFVTCAGAVLAAPFAAGAQQAGKVYRVGYLSGIADPSVPRIETFRQAMAALGWKDGETVVIEYRSAGGNSERFAELAADLVHRGVDVIVAQIPAAVLAVAKETQTIPIVMVNAPDPVQFGLVGSLARPGGNITGLTTLSADLSGKQFELLKALIPRLARVAILSNPTNPWHPIALDGIAARAKSLQVLINIMSVRGPDQLDASFAAMVREQAGAVHVLADPMTVVARSRVAELALKHRLPAMGSVSETTEAGLLASYWPNSEDLHRRAATYVDRILRGARPGDIPIEQPTKYDFVINLKTAKILGLRIPQSLLLRADRVIE